MKSYRELIVWGKSIDLVEEVYRLTQKLPPTEQFGLTNQLRRAAVSIPSNIAEGYGRNAAKEYIRFLNIARGSKNEIETQLLICTRLKFLKNTDIENALSLCEEIGRMFQVLSNRLTPYI